MEQYAILKFAEALEVIPRVLLDNSGVDSTHAIASLTAAHQNGQKFAGVDVNDGKVIFSFSFSFFFMFFFRWWMR